MIVVGVDPGGRWTGIITRDGDQIINGCVITRVGEDVFPDAAYVDEVLNEITAQIEHADAMAVEGVREPEPHAGMINVAGLMGTCIIFGAVLARWPRAVVVPPGGNGSLPDFAYPPAIRKYKRLGGPSIHARSAYDVARVGEVVIRATRATTGGPR